MSENTQSKVKESKVKESKVNTIPSFEEFKEYSIEKKPKVDRAKLKLKYDSWVENDWHDGNGKEITNWKLKILSTLPYIDEYKSGTKFASPIL